MSNLLTDYLAHLADQPNRFGRTVSQATVRAARADLRGFVAWWEAHQQLTFDPSLVQERDLRDWQRDRQTSDGARPATINRASASLRSFFAWALATNLIRRDPAAPLRDVRAFDNAPPSLSPDAVTWLFRAASNQTDTTARARDLALLTLLSDCGLRSQEAADIQLRDLDLAGGTVTVRAGKGGTMRRVPIEGEGLRRLREYLALRCPGGVPRLGSDAEREPLLQAYHRTNGKGSWEPGLRPVSMRKRLAELGQDAATLVVAQIKREQKPERIAMLEESRQLLLVTSPHKLRHGLGYRLRKSGADAGYIQKILGHSRPTTALRYGQPTERDLREVLRRANNVGHSTPPPDEHS